MKTDLVHLDLFSGIGGFTQGLIQAGYKIKKHLFAEVDKHAQAIYKYKFPKAKAVGDVRHVRGSELGGVDIISFGSPCQDFSLAGKRRGMDGERSSLITEAIRLIDECRPDFFIWENVKGTFSSNNGEDFISILQAFTNLGGYRLEWQLLNTAWFLPQNRERIYLVGRIADGCQGSVFPIGETSGFHNKSKTDGEVCVNNKARTLTSRAHASWNGDFIKIGTWRTHKDGEGFREVQDSNCPTIPARGREDGSGQPVLKVGAIRGRNPENPKSRVSGLPTEQIFEENKKSIANALTTVQKDTVLKISQKPRGNNKGGLHEVCPTITSNSFEHNNHVDSIRRLTEIECERLQGFSDNWTQYGNYDGEVKQVPASQRYKCLGNAVTVDVVQAVGEAILKTTEFKKVAA